MTADTPPFSLVAPRYDPATFVGRFRNMLNVIDPRTLVVSDAEVRAEPGAI